MTKMTRAAALATLVLAVIALAPAAATASPSLTVAPPSRAFSADVARGYGYIHSPVTVRSGSSSLLPMLRAGTLPPTYDLRTVIPGGRLTAVRDQGPDGTCWAFASMGALESYLMPGENLDLSEDNLVTRSGFGPFTDGPYTHGGNFTMAAAYLARWSGPLAETTDPYPSPGTRPTGPVRNHVQGITFLAPRTSATDNDAIKSAVMADGAVTAGMYIDPDNASYYNSTSGAFYYDGTGAQQDDHAVAIVGWDDAYPAAAFATAPGGDGAFLVRNSWGTGWGVDASGYFWVSYYDANFARNDIAMALSRVDPTGVYNRVYSYDKLGWIKSVGLKSSTARFANRFTAQSAGHVAAVGFYTDAPGATYTVYAGPTLAKLTARGSDTLSDAGYATVPLAKTLRVAANARFVVAVRITVPGDTLPVAVEMPLNGYAKTTASAGQSYLRVGTKWIDLTTQSGYRNANVCLKAYTTK
jgi:C1A family cysteine protease